MVWYSGGNNQCACLHVGKIPFWMVNLVFSTTIKIQLNFHWRFCTPYWINRCWERTKAAYMEWMNSLNWTLIKNVNDSNWDSVINKSLKINILYTFWKWCSTSCIFQVNVCTKHNHMLAPSALRIVGERLFFTEIQITNLANSDFWCGNSATERCKFPRIFYASTHFTFHWWVCRSFITSSHAISCQCERFIAKSISHVQ